MHQRNLKERWQGFGNIGKMGLETTGKLSKIVPFPPIFLPFPINFTHFLHISQNVLLQFLTIPRFLPFPPHSPLISPHFPPFFHLPHFPKPLWPGGEFGCG